MAKRSSNSVRCREQGVAQRQSPASPAAACQSRFSWLEPFWLIAVAVVPCFVNPLSRSMFESDKAALVRLLGGAAALVGLVMLAVRLLQRKALPRLPLFQSPLFLAAIIYGGVMLLASSVSLDPGRSFWGTVQRGRGFFTLLVEFVAFAGVATGLRSRQQLERLAGAVLLGSLPVATVAILQGAGLYPVADVFGGRSSSLLGNPIFVGSYLCMVVPLTLWMGWTAACRRRWVRVGALSLLFLAQVCALGLTGSRGPILACGVSLAVSGLALLLSLGFRRTGTWLALVGVLGIGLATGMMLQRVSPDRLADVEQAEADGIRVNTVQVRLWVYRAVSARMRDGAPIVAREQQDEWARARWLFGYGPQCLAMAVDKYFPSELEQLEREGTAIDAAHSRLLEVWAEAGLLGVAAYLGLLGALFVSCLRLLGWACDREQTVLLATSLLVGAGLTAAAFAIWWGIFAWALGALVGLALGLPLYFLLSAARGAPGPVKLGERWRRIATVAVVAALLAAVVDGQFGVQTVAPGLIFWCLAGVVVALPRVRADEPQEASCLANGALVVVAVAVGTVLFGSMAGSVDGGARTEAAFAFDLFTGLPGGLALLLMLFAVVLSTPSSRSPHVFWLWGGVGVGALLLSAVCLWNTGRLLAVWAEYGLNRHTAEWFADQTWRRVVWRMLLPMLGCVVLAGFVAGRWRVRALFVGLWAAAVLFSVVAVLPVIRQTIEPDTRLALAKTFQARGDSARADALARSAVFGPWRDDVLAERYPIHAAAAANAPSTAVRDRLMASATRSLERAIAASPYDARHYDQLGGVLQVWAAGSRGVARKKRARAAMRAFDDSLQLAPRRTSVRVKQAALAYGLLEDRALLDKVLREALSMDPEHVELLAAMAFLLEDRARQGDATRQRAFLKSAAEYAARALHVPVVGVKRVDRARMQQIIHRYEQMSGQRVDRPSPVRARGSVPRLGMLSLSVLQLLVALGLAMLLTPTVRCLAPRLGLIDMPAVRKAHVTPTPMMGGAAIYAAWMVAGMLAWPAWALSQKVLMLAATALFVVGLCDDRRNLAWGWKMGLQIVLAAGLYGVGVRVQLGWLPAWCNLALTMFWLVGITNGVNFLDNMDGLAAGLGAIAAGAFSVMGAMHGCWDVAGISAALAGACIGFLRFNGWNATIFMGDAGSLVLGMLLAGLGLVVRFPEGLNWVTWMAPVLVMGVPVLDTSLVVISRLRRGVNPFSTPGKDHVSHRLVRLGLRKQTAVACVWAGGGVCALLGVAVTLFPPAAAYAVGAGYLLVYLSLIVTLEVKLPYRQP